MEPQIHTERVGRVYVAIATWDRGGKRARAQGVAVTSHQAYAEALRLLRDCPAVTRLAA